LKGKCLKQSEEFPEKQTPIWNHRTTRAHPALTRRTRIRRNIKNKHRRSVAMENGIDFSERTTDTGLEDNGLGK
jgi:hypothetical protein